MIGDRRGDCSARWAGLSRTGYCFFFLFFLFFLLFLFFPLFCIFFAVCDVNLEKIIIARHATPRHATIYSFPPLEMHRGEKHTTVCAGCCIHFFFDFCILYLDFIGFSFLCYFFVLLLLILSWVQFVFL